jgi:hypothetical protein
MACIQTMLSIAADTNVAACLDTSDLLPIMMGIAAQSTDSMIQPIDTWVKGMCALPACSNDVISGVVNKLSSGCSAEFSLSQSQASQTAAAVQKYYPTARQVGCLAR